LSKSQRLPSRLLSPSLTPNLIESGVDVVYLKLLKACCFLVLKSERISFPLIRSYQGSFISPSKLNSSKKLVSAYSPPIASPSTPINRATLCKWSSLIRWLF